jgi:hypothetical protein
MRPLKSLRLPCGLKLPVKGADPVFIASEASSSNKVFVKLSPDAPKSVNKITSVVPSGAIIFTSKSSLLIIPSLIDVEFASS